MIRKAILEELDVIEDIYEEARNAMRRNGNPSQWGDSYPKHALLVEDVDKSRLFVIEREGCIVGAFVFFIGDDPTYQSIDGAWHSSNAYGAIHRIAGKDNAHGILQEALAFASANISYLRIDTHRDNKIMQHLLTKNGFQYTGIIHTYDGTERLAYDRILLC